MKYNRALVTGGAGFIGSHIAALLVAKGIETVVVDNFYMGKKENIPPKAKVVKLDILDSAKLNKAMRGVDVVFHDAARVSIRNSIGDFQNDAAVNITGTVNVIQGVIKNKVRKLIYASSMAVYGDAEYLPMDESHRLDPVSPYGISKLAGEKYCLRMGEFFDFAAVALRYFNTYGTRQTFTPYVGVITIFINRLLENKAPVIFGDGKQSRDFVSVEDVARANILAMEKPVRSEAFNIGSGESRSVNQIAGELIRHINPRIKPEHGPAQSGEPNSSVADIAKAKKLLSYQPRFRLEDKIQDIIEWNKKTRIK